MARQLGAGGGALIDAAKQAFIDGIGAAALTGATVVTIAAVIARRTLPRTQPQAAPQASVGDVAAEVLEETVPVAAR